MTTPWILMFMVEIARIKVTENGPYIVIGGIPLLRMIIETDSYGDPLRCARAQPYCDGTHVKEQFDGAETAGNERYLENVRDYVGPELKLTDKRELCVGADLRGARQGTGDVQG